MWDTSLSLKLVSQPNNKLNVRISYGMFDNEGRQEASRNVLIFTTIFQPSALIISLFFSSI